MRKPIIGLVLALTAEDHQFTPQPAYRFEYLKQHYYEAIENQGGVAIGIPNTEHDEYISQYCEIIDGLLLVGGEDINPELYGERLDPLSKPLMPRRDYFEARILRACFDRRIPILGICRGLQILNVAFGGTLYQDLSYRPGARSHSQIGQLDFSTRHHVTISPDTLLHNVLSAARIETNTAHHQGISRLGEGLKVSARSEDGVIEAIESEGFTLAVQWHPEAWSHDEFSCKIFSSFCEAARGVSAEKLGSVKR